MNPEQQHQQRRHQRSAADAGEADEEADEEAGEGVEGGGHFGYLNWATQRNLFLDPAACADCPNGADKRSPHSV